MDGSRFPVYLMNGFRFPVCCKWFSLNGKNSTAELRKLFTRLNRIRVNDVIVFRLPLGLWSEVLIKSYSDQSDWKLLNSDQFDRNKN